jgi:hypothetical protein
MASSLAGRCKMPTSRASVAPLVESHDHFAQGFSL